MTAHYTNATKSADRVDGYIAKFRTTLTLRLRTQRVNGHDIADIVQSEATRLWVHFDDITARYPNPEIYAALRAQKGRALTDYMRKQGSQRGTGAIVKKDPTTGAVVKGRVVLAGEQPYRRDAYDPSARDEFTGSCFDRYAAQHPVFDDPADFIDGNEMLAAAMLKVSPRQRILLMRVICDRDKVGEVAAELGITRETASRDLSEAKRIVAAFLAHAEDTND
jgi:RNA polymerase sigma factor (sigma-70 family)